MVTMMQSSARSIHRVAAHCLKATPTRPSGRHPNSFHCSFSSSALLSTNGQAEVTTSSATPQNNSFSHRAHRSLSTAATKSSPLEQRRHSILTHALQRVHEEGWTDDAVASGTLDAGLPPSYIGQASSATSPFGSADLVAFFMEECNAKLKSKLDEDEEKEKAEQQQSPVRGRTQNDVAPRINHALQLRLSMVLPFVSSSRWHEAMAIGALPQNSYRTAQQLDGMADSVLNYAMGKNANHNNNYLSVQRAAIVAAYAAAELHLLSDGKEGTVSGNSLSLSGDQYHATWNFLEARSAEVARLLIDGTGMPSFNGVVLPNPTHVMAASAVASSLAGAAFSLATPSAAAMAGNVLPRAIASVLTPLQTAVMGSPLMNNMNSGNGRDGTRPSDYVATTESLPPFDASEEFFPDRDSNGKAA